MYSRFFLVVFYLINLQQSYAQDLKPHQTVMIPMRDGHELPTDLYFPGENLSEYPCVLVRSPAGRTEPFVLFHVSLIKDGYVVAIQETRSANDKEGKTFPWWTDGWGELQDGYDTVEWLAQSPYCNGKIGTAGMSALGITQNMLAPSAPPSLKCQHIGVAASSVYHHGLFPGGQLLKDQVEGWLGRYAWDHGVYCCAINQPFYNDFWKRMNTVDVAENIDVPAVHYGGWYDVFLQGTIDGFVSRQEKGAEGARGKQKLLLGPWTHYWPKVTTLGDFDVPAQGYQPPVDLSLTTWLDIHLKGDSKKADELPAVTYYVMGPFDGTESKGNVWKTSDVWPVPHEKTPFYLTLDHKLDPKGAPHVKHALMYQCDPDDPVPTVGGRNLFLEAGAKDQREIEARKDVLVFTTEPLEEDLEITGSVITKLFLTSSHEDTDVVVRLTDVYPDGRSILITDGIYRTGLDHCLGCVSSSEEPREIEVDLWATSIVFAKGHRIRISITSSNYPRFEKNFNTGVVGSYSGKSEIAENTIHLGRNYPSHIELPVVH